MSTYLKLLIEAKIKEGLQPPEARRAAWIELGVVEQVKEQVRASVTGAWLDAMCQDVRQAYRSLRHARIRSLGGRKSGD